MCTDYRSVGLWNSGVPKEKPVTENKLNSWQQALIYIGASVAVGKCNLYCGEMAIFAQFSSSVITHYSAVVSLIVKSFWGPMKNAILRCLGRAENGNQQQHAPGQLMGMGAVGNQANPWQI